MPDKDVRTGKRVGIMLATASGMALAGSLIAAAAPAAPPTWRLGASFPKPLTAVAAGGVCSGRLYTVVAGQQLEASAQDAFGFRTGTIIGAPTGAVVGVQDVAAAAKKPKIAYAASTLGVLKTVDGGATWRVVSTWTTSILNYPNRLSVSSDGSTIYVASPAGDPLMVSSDGGRSWRAAGPVTVDGQPVGGSPAPLVSPRRSKTVFGVMQAGTAARPYYRYYVVARSTDGGQTWEAHRFPDPIQALAVVPTRPATLIAASVGGFYRSDDGGHSWRGLMSAGITDVLGQGVAVRRVVATREPRWRLFALTGPTPAGNGVGAGIWQSRDQGKSWTQVSPQAGKVTPSDIALTSDGTRLIAAGQLGGRRGGISVRATGGLNPACS